VISPRFKVERSAKTRNCKQQPKCQTINPMLPPDKYRTHKTLGGLATRIPPLPNYLIPCSR